MRSPGAALALGVIRLYKWVPRLRSPSCRFDPTCSTFTFTAIERFGLVKGLFLGARRIGRCHPWGGTGWDPVPPMKGSANHG
ncbi:MAG: membrane protein insertion efficiency factor YidD [Actinomycetota bacterium]|nr:membrane protein insertion efficiency factor YidD [Actinomycetota bacterium]